MGRWTDPHTPTWHTPPVAGCSPVNNPPALVPGAGFVQNLVLDRNLIIFSANAGIQECPKAGGCPSPTTVVPFIGTDALAAQGGFIYYVSGNVLYGVAE